MRCILVQSPESGGKHQLGLRNGDTHLLLWWFRGRNKFKEIIFICRTIPLGRCPMISHSLPTNLLRKVVIYQNSTQISCSWRSLSSLFCVLDLPQLHLSCCFSTFGWVAISPIRMWVLASKMKIYSALHPQYLVLLCAWHIACNQ